MLQIVPRNLVSIGGRAYRNPAIPADAQEDPLSVAIYSRASAPLPAIRVSRSGLVTRDGCSQRHAHRPLARSPMWVHAPTPNKKITVIQQHL